MTIPFDAIVAIGVALLGIVSAVAHRSRCFIRHVNEHWDWGVGYDDQPIVPDDAANGVSSQSSTKCADILAILVGRLRGIISGRG